MALFGKFSRLFSWLVIFETGRDGKIMKNIVAWMGLDGTVGANFLDGTGRYSTMTFLFHDGTGGRDGK